MVEQIYTLIRPNFEIFRILTNLSANTLNNDLLKTNNWAQYQWKMSFNPDPSKEAQEVTFSLKIKKPSHPVLILNNNHVIQTPYQKDIGLILDEKLNFGEHLRYILLTKSIHPLGYYVNFKHVY